MTVLEIRQLGDPVLRQEAQPVAEIDDEIRRLIEDMKATMYDADGVGLAAPQVGVLHRVIVIDVRENDIQPFALVNPIVVESSIDLEKGEEGCLSIPGVRDVVERPARVIVEGLDEKGEKKIVAADGLLARALQHEVDHLNGVLFIDRLSPIKRRLLLQRFKKASKS